MGYPGGKSGPGVYHRLINLMPPHQTYIEPFLGGGAIMRLKRPAPYNIGVDLDAAVIREWRSRIGENALAVRDGEKADSSGGIGEAHDGPVNPPPPVATLGKNASGGSQVFPPISADACGSTDTISADPCRRRSAGSPIAVSGPADEVPRFRFLHGDALTFLQSYPFAPDDLIYCDPPYLPRTLSSRQRYRHKFGETQHEELLATILELPCRVMISGYTSPLYGGALNTWSVIHFEAMTRGGMATEWLWFNFEPPVELHDYRYLGETAHRRQDLKRQIASWTGKLSRMSALKRQALLAAIGSTIGGNDGGIR